MGRCLLRSERFIVIHVLIPSYNCTPWIRRTLESVAKQTCAPTKVLVIDDASTDFEYEPLVTQLCEKFGYEYYRNRVNHKCPHNLRLGIDLLGPEADDVIFLLDGDDFLPHKKVFSRIVEVYENPDIWLTYGNYRPYPRNTGQHLAFAYPDQVIKERSFRTAAACFNHPITFRKHLWDHVTDVDMQTSRGKWFTGGYDMVIMSAMLELATPHNGIDPHWRFLDETLYGYNAINPLSDAIINVRLVEESREMMRRRKKNPL